MRRTRLGQNIEQDVSKIKPYLDSSGIAGDHGALGGLGDDDHPQYVHVSVARSIIAQHTFAPTSAQPPFALNANAQGQTVVGLRADQLNKSVLAGDGLAAGGLLTADVTIDLDTPGTLSVSSPNAAAGNHTHAITTSNNPGAAAAILATDAAGDLTLESLTVTNLLDAGSVELVGGDISADNWVSGTTGWGVTYAGAADFRDVSADTLTVDVFTLAAAQSLVGSIIVTKSRAKLSRDFKIPSAETIVFVDPATERVDISGAEHYDNIDVGQTFDIVGSTGNDGTYTVASKGFVGGVTSIIVNEDITDSTADGSVQFKRTLYVEDLEELGDGIAVFAAGDYVRLRYVDYSGGGLVVTDAWGIVSAYSNLAGGEQSWTFTATDDGNVGGNVISARSLALDYGQADDGVWEATVLDSAGSPYSQVTTWVTDPSVPGNFTTHVRLGNLDGIAGVGNEYGLWAGQDGNTYVLASDSSLEAHGLRLSLYQGTTETVRLDPTVPSLAIGNPLPTAVDAGGDGFWAGYVNGIGGEYRVRIGKAAGPKIQWSSNFMYFVDANGNLPIILGSTGNAYFGGVVNIGASGEIRQGTGTLGTNFTGLRLWHDSNVGRIAGYNSDTPQWYADTDGRIYAGGGVVRLDNNGINYLETGQRWYIGGSWGAGTLYGTVTMGAITSPVRDQWGFVMNASRQTGRQDIELKAQGSTASGDRKFIVSAGNSLFNFYFDGTKTIHESVNGGLAEYTWRHFDVTDTPAYTLHMGNTGWHRGSYISVNADYDGSGEPYQNMSYSAYAASNIPEGLLYFFKGNSGEFYWYTAPDSTGVGNAATFTQRMALGVGLTVGGAAPPNVDGRILAYRGNSGGTPHAASGVIIERNSNIALQLLSTDSDTNWIFFGDATNAVVGRITYDHSVDQISLWAGNTKRAHWQGNVVTMPGVYNTTTTNAANVHVKTGGQLFRSTSSLRYKRDIEPLALGLAAVRQLQPVYYRSKIKADGDQRFAGLTAENVAQILPEGVERDARGRPEAIRYPALTALLTKAIIELDERGAGLAERVAALERLVNSWR